jgi:xylulokinase
VQHLLGVDVGSSECKAMLIDTLGVVRARSRLAYPTHRPRPGWVEQDPDDWYHAACRAIRACLAGSGVAPTTILALSIDGPAHNVALMDASWNVLRPSIHWSDLRSVREAESLEADHGEHIFGTTYSPVNPSWTLTQLLWLRAREPSIWAQLKRILVTKDYVRFRLTGGYDTDVYDAIGTQLYDVGARAWSSYLCDLAEFPQEWLPTVRGPKEIGGRVTQQAASDTGLPAGLPVAVGSGDSVVEALGVGATRPGDCLVKLGTAANVNLVTASASPSRQSITYRHIVDPTWFSITATNSGTATIRWFRDTFCRVEAGADSRAAGDGSRDVAALAAQAPAGCQGLLFHPYLSGERSPHWDPYLRGDFVGIHILHELHHFARATLEGVAFSIRDCFEVVERLGERVERISLIGGGAKSDLWSHIVCDVLGRPMYRPAIEDAAFGAAMVAGVAVGVFDGWEEAGAVCAGVDKELEPRPAEHATYDEMFRVYRRVTEGIRGPIKELARLTPETELIHAHSNTEHP